MIALVSVNYLAYKNALKQAWKDGKMSADESAMLDTLRKSLNISPEEHLKIEHDVRGELAGLPPEANELPEGNDPHAPNPAPESASVPEPEQLAEAQNFEGPMDPNDINGLLIAGKNSYHKGNYEEAIEYCDKVLLLDPDNSEALFFRKRTLSKIEKLRGTGDAGAGEVEASANAGIEVEPAPIEPETEVKEKAKTSKAGKAKGAAGDPNCKSCAGSGECHWCKGSGKCYWCKGTGKCEKCDGSGKIGDEECKSCKGTGKCHSCNGDSECYWCKGTGKCSKCSM